MDNMIYFQVFEFAAVIFETFIVYQYLNDLFNKDDKEKNTFIWYALFLLGLSVVSLLIKTEIVLILYTVIGVYVLALRLHKSGISSGIFSVFYFCAIMVSSEILTVGLISDIWNIDLNNVLDYGVPRALCILVAKLFQILLVKLSVAVASWKKNSHAKDGVKMMLPLLLCHVFSICLAHYVAWICLEVYSEFDSMALFSMIGIIYINIIMFWYFDRIQAILLYKTKSEVAERTLEIQKQYYAVLSEHQMETDLLWHDMKKHINLMKTLLNNGQQDITLEYVHELELQMEDTVKIIYTNYPVLSALLTEQMQRARRGNVTFNLDVRLESSMKITPVDMCVILGNLFDNAFAACNALSSDLQKKINTSIIQHERVIAIRVENTYMPNYTTNQATGRGGLGQKNIRNAVAKYDGQFSITAKDGFYIVDIIIP